MTPHLRLTLAVAALTLLLVLTRPRGWHEAWWTAGGGALMLALRLETPAQAWQVMRTGQDALLFLLALLLRVRAKFMMKAERVLPPPQSLPVRNCTRRFVPATSPALPQHSSASPLP